jgi:Bacterial Ig domain/Right handed beta helix region
MKPFYLILPAVLSFAAGATHAQTGGRTIQLNPGSSFETAVESLQPGDTLIVSPGTYTDTGRISITVRGTASAPVVVKGVDGQARPVITRPAGAAVQNTINVEGATYLTIKGLEIVGNGGDGINMNGGPSNITLEDLDIHDVDVGVNFRSSMNNITVRRNHIHRTGIGGGTGEGMYVGCNDAACIVRDSLIENNWIHDALPGTTQGDGIEVKVGSHSNVVRDNVIYNRPYPGIFVYGTGTNPSNLVEGNVIWNCLEGIYAVADAIVRNNIVIGSGTGLSLYPHVQVAQIKNIVAVNNTLYGNSSGVYMRWGSGVSNVRLANNAIYSPGKAAVDAGSGIAAGAAVAANYIEGSSSVAIDNARFFDGGSAGTAFVDAANRDFWPRAGSLLIDRGSATEAPALDFNRSARSAPIDVGAYEALGLAANPGWRITEGFKGVSTGGGGGGDTSAPSVSINAPSPGSGALSGTVTLMAAAADNVAVVGVQFRLNGASLGSEITAAPYSMSWDSTTVANGSHTLTAVARDAAGNSTVSSPVVVTVANAAPPPPPPAANAGGGGGCTLGSASTTDPMLAWLLLLSVGTLAWRRRTAISPKASSSPRTAAH